MSKKRLHFNVSRTIEAVNKDKNYTGSKVEAIREKIFKEDKGAFRDLMKKQPKNSSRFDFKNYEF